MSGASYPDLDNRTVYITGGATGIGAAFVQAFADQGGRVAFFDIDETEGDALADQLNETGHECLFQPCDLADAEGLRAAFQDTCAEFGDAEVLINNAADDSRHDFESLSPEAWDRLIAVNLRHQFFAAQAVAASMADSGGGSIINLTSTGFLSGATGYPAYVAATAGVAGLTKSLARELGAEGVRVNAIAPGWVMTEKQKKLWLTDEAEAELMEAQALKEKIRPEDVADLALFLASDASRMITGGLHVIDAGRW
ncbi:MAG: SDR family oxidoreductase [Pseudomonadota bacterium]